MKGKFRLWFNLTALVLLFALVFFGVGSLLAKSIFLVDQISIRNEVENLTLDLVVEINKKESFTYSAVNGKAEHDIYELPREDTTFTENRDVIEFSFKFENKSNQNLSITISGIHFDQKERFTTEATDYYGDEITIQKNGNKGSLTFILNGKMGENASFEEGSLFDVILLYKHIERNLSINGLESDVQILTITIQHTAA